MAHPPAYRLSILRVLRRTVGLIAGDFPSIALTAIPILAPLVWLLMTTYDKPSPMEGFFEVAVPVFVFAATQTYLAALLAPLARGRSIAIALPRSPLVLVAAVLVGTMHGTLIASNATGIRVLGILLVWFFFLVGPVTSMEKAGLPGSFGRSMVVAFPDRRRMALLIVVVLLFGFGAVGAAVNAHEIAGLVMLPIVMTLLALVQAVTYDEMLGVEEASAAALHGS